MYEILRNTPLFTGKTAAEIKACLAPVSFHTSRYEKGELIFRMDQDADSIGILLAGQVAVEKNHANGKVTPVLLQRPGDIFGEAAVFSDAGTYPCNVVSRGDSRVLFISRRVLLQLLAADQGLLTNFLHLFANKILMLNRKTELLACDSIRQKIVFSLLHELRDYTLEGRIRLPYSKKFWAESLDVSRPSLYRELASMEKDGLIQLTAKDIVILNYKALTVVLST